MTTPDSGLLNRLDTLIDARLAESDLSLDTLSAELGVSRSSLFRLLKEQTGLSPSHYLRHRRLLMARHLVLTTDLRMTEIAVGVGIDSPQNFTKYFTESFGTSPSDFRKGHATDAKAVPLPPAETAPPMPIPAPTPRSRRVLGMTPRVGWLVVAGLLLAGAGWAARWRILNQPDTTHPVSNSIAVLPFHNEGTKEIAYLCDGLAGQIQTSLMLVEPLTVISRTSTRTYENSTRPVGQIARELGVAYLLTGNLLRLGNRVQLSVELIRASRNQTIWTHTYTGEMNNVVGFTGEVAKTVAAELNQELSQRVRQRIDRVPTKNAQAYNEYLKGEYLLRSRTGTGIRTSMHHFDRAIALDSTFANAYAAKGTGYFLLASDYKDAALNMKQAEKQALRAIQFDAENAGAYALLGNLYKMQNKWEQATTTYQIALRYSPNDALTNYWYSLCLRSTGHLREAVRYSANALRLDPVYPVILVGHIINLAYAGDMRQATKAIQEGRQLHAGVYLWYWAEAFYHLLQNQPAQARTAFATMARLNPEVRDSQIQVAWLDARAGQSGPAQALLKTLPQRPETLPDRALLYAGLGQTDSCLTALEQGAEWGYLPDYLAVSVQYRFLHKNPRFRAVLRQVGLPDTLVLPTPN